MTTQEVRQTLGNEVCLLDHMIANVRTFDGTGFTKQGQFIKDSWERFLGDRRSTNIILQKANDADLKSDLEEELDQVEKYIRETADSPNYTEGWRKFLDCERSILEYLINLC